jgi:hypothetical protein
MARGESKIQVATAPTRNKKSRPSFRDVKRLFIGRMFWVFVLYGKGRKVSLASLQMPSRGSYPQVGI